MESAMNNNILFSCVSHIGNCRSMNQDNVICNGKYMDNLNENAKFFLSGTTSNESAIFGVFDGMGGEECGEIASSIAAKNASRISVGKDAIADISKYCLDANEEICKYAQNHSINSMGTTAAILVFTKCEIVLCNIGDSKIFRFSKNTIEQISYDHVVVSAYGVKPPLSQNLGIPPNELIIDPYMAKGQYVNGDIYLICSDGLTDMLAVDEIKDILAIMPFNKVTEVLLSKALDKGGKDNITIIVCKIKSNTNWLKRIFKIRR